MAKKVEADGFVSPASLWGKPLPAALHKTAEAKKGATRMRTEDDDDEIDLDVDAELEEDGPSDDDLLSDEEDETSVEPVMASSEDTDDETEEDDDDVVASAVEVDDPEPVAAENPTTQKKRATSPMAEKKSISDHVREEIAARKASGDSLRGVDIVNALAKKKIKVSPAQVSQLLKKAGVGQKARGKRAAVAAETAEKSRIAEKARKHSPEPTKAAKAVTSDLPIAQLRAAKAFLDACGGSYADAERALSMHAELGAIL